MGDGTKENPFNSADVYMRIAENGHIAEGLDLSGKYFEEGIDLTELDLTGAILNGAVLNRAVLKRAGLDKCHLKAVRLIGANLEGAFLEEAHLEGANLSGAHLKNAKFVGAHLEKARLTAAHLEGAELFDAYLEEANLINTFLDRTRLSGAHLQGVELFDAKFSANTEMESVDWGNYILGEEGDGKLKQAADTYRRLKVWYTGHGLYNLAGEFFYREMEARRKDLKSRLNPFHIHRLWLELFRFLSGYGEKPWRVVGWSGLVLFGLALLYFFLRGVAPYTLTLQAFSSSLYYSAVSFTALGYGPWFSAGSVRGWVQGVGAAEAIIGVFMIALFLVTFTRKMMR